MSFFYSFGPKIGTSVAPPSRESTDHGLIVIYYRIRLNVPALLNALPCFWAVIEHSNGGFQLKIEQSLVLNNNMFSSGLQMWHTWYMVYLIIYDNIFGWMYSSDYSRTMSIGYTERWHTGYSCSSIPQCNSCRLTALYSRISTGMQQVEMIYYALHHQSR